MGIFIFNIVILAVVVIGIRFWRESQKDRHNFHHTLGIALLIFMVGAFLALAAPVGIFSKIQFMTWVVFLHIPLFFAVVSLMLVRRKCKWTLVVLSLSLLIFGVGIDALLIEPYWLEVTHYEIKSDKITEPVRIVVLADIQTDKIDEFEEKVFELTKEARPDLVLLAGDYLQIYDKEKYRQESDKFRELLNRVGLEPKYGVYAVKGNHEFERPWQEIFEGTDVQVKTKQRTMDLGEISLTCLGFEDSCNSGLRLDKKDGYHIVLGHVPNFSLGENEADLLIAGHTHGGQVQLPFVGPLVTFASVPRDWASGMTEISPGKYLLVSRGLGLEHHGAPKMRFLCRPELAIIDLAPLDSREGEQ